MIKTLLLLPFQIIKEKRDISKHASIEHGETHFYAKDDELKEFWNALDLLEEIDSDIYEEMKSAGCDYIYDSSVDLKFTATGCRLSRAPDEDEGNLIAKIVVYYFKHKQAQEGFTKTLKEDPDFVKSDFRIQAWANQLTERLNQPEQATP